MSPVFAVNGQQCFFYLSALFFSHSRDALLTSTVNCVTSFFSGFAIFSVLGYMAKKHGVDIKDVATEGKQVIM